MSVKRIVSQRIYLFILSFIALLVFVYAGVRVYYKVCEKRNQIKIQQAMESADPHPEKLLELKHLTVKQNYVIYKKLCELYYSNGKAKDFLSVAGYGLFYSELTGNIEHAVYLYSLLAQYYLEMGADKSGYEMILNGRRLKNFYTIKTPVIRSQALHGYGRFLLYESDFEDALKAEAQMEEDAIIIEESNSFLAKHFKRRALAFKSYIMMMQGKTEEAYALALDAYEKYFDGSEEFNHIIVYDFLLPIFKVEIEWALRNKNYQKALEYYRDYAKFTKKYGFTMKRTVMTKELMFALPFSMHEEREQLFKELAQDTDILSQNILDEYTDVTGEKLFGLIQNLRYINERADSQKHTLSNIVVMLIVLLIVSLILLLIYSETQIDGLTKLRNRRALNQRIGRQASSGKKYSAIMIDIDNFKKLNDTYGHDFGDEVLRGVAGILVEVEDRNVKCYRYGGEEMVVILEHYTLEKAVRFSERIRNEIASKKWRNDVQVTASFGLGFEMSDSLKEADENMYVAKQKGKNFTAYKKDGIQYLAERRLDIREPIPDVE